MAAKKPAAKKKAAAKRKPAAKKPPEPEIQTNRTMSPNDFREEHNMSTSPPVEEETQEERDAAGEARRQKVLGSQESEADSNVHEPYHKPLENAGFDHLGAEQERQAELAAQREEHNRRTGDASLR